MLSEWKKRTERGGHALDKDEHDNVEICPDQEVAENKEGVKHILKCAWTRWESGGGRDTVQ